MKTEDEHTSKQCSKHVSSKKKSNHEGNKLNILHGHIKKIY